MAGARHQRRRSESGFSLLEFLVVTVITAILLAGLVPLAAERLQSARARAMVNQFGLDLRAARWTAVSSRAPVDFVVSADPANSYQYTDMQGRVRTVELPRGVRITSSTSPIRFLANGAVTGGATTVIESAISDDAVSRWTVATNSIGVSHTTLEQVGP